ncbi:MAG TPA: hypothetical protein ENK19_06970 [Acidobacteria bacterium]|nr:hypothetical protein [Acidobacteriota bacterium]
MNLRELWRWLAVASAAAALGLGVTVDLPRPGRPAAPVWAAHLSALRGAPLPPHGPVPLIVPGRLAPGDARKLLMEIVWQRPEVEWRPMVTFPRNPELRRVVVVGPGFRDVEPPRGWRRIWSRGWIGVYRWVGP